MKRGDIGNLSRPNTACLLTTGGPACTDIGYRSLYVVRRGARHGIPDHKGRAEERPSPGPCHRTVVVTVRSSTPKCSASAPEGVAAASAPGYAPEPAFSATASAARLSPMRILSKSPRSKAQEPKKPKRGFGRPVDSRSEKGSERGSQD